MRFLLFLALPLFFLIFCSSNPKPPANSTMLTLISGKTVRVYTVTRISFVNNQLPPSLILTYETAFQPADSKELRSEVQEVFLVGLQARADSSGDSYAMVKASAPQRGPRTETFTYSFNKAGSGKWLLREPGK